MVLYDPLDGSSNIDVNVSIGSIFSIPAPQGGERPHGARRFPPAGRGAGLRGLRHLRRVRPCWSTPRANGVDGFTLDPSVGEFFLSHPDIRVPERGKIYSINEGNSSKWDGSTSRYVAYLKEEDAENGPRPISGRYNRLAGGRFPQKPAQGRHLPLSGRQEKPGRQAAPSLRVQPDVLHRGAGGGRRERTAAAG